jgi:N-acyl-D-aspartate/D-glutamate deacylase
MAKLVEDALHDGVIGISTGLAYEPGRYSPTDEIVQLTKLVANANGIYATHMRNDGDELLASVKESLHIGAETGARIQISHLKVMGKRNHGSIGDAVQLIQEARQQGIDVMADQYPYTRGSTILDQLVSGGQIIAINKNGLHHLESLLISSAPQHQEWEGMTLRDLAQQLSLGDRETVEYALAECGRSLFVVIDSLNEDDVRKVMQEDFVMIGSDGVPAGSKPHPRLHHTFPRILAEYVRNLGLLSLPAAIHKMTGLSAQRFGLTNRGFIADGYAADLVLFDPRTVQDTGTYIEPTTVPIGIKKVWVNGTLVADDGQTTGNQPGVPLIRQ